MAIDFDEEVSKTKLSTCEQHNLKFDPAATWGCVLCRTNQKKRISGYLVVGAILLVAAGFYYLFPVVRPGDESHLSSVVSVGDRSTDVTESPESTEYPCRLQLSSKIEKCISKVDSESSNARMDKEFCLDSLGDLANQCKGTSIPQDYLEEPLYSVSDLPKWQSIRSKFEMDQEKIEKCMNGASYSFSTRIHVDGETGRVADSTLSLFGLNTSQRFCLYQFFESLEFPHDTGKSYTFVTQIDSNLIAMNKPKKEDNRAEEFKKFLESERKAKVEEERRVQIMKKRGQIDNQFKQEMAPQ